MMFNQQAGVATMMMMMMMLAAAASVDQVAVSAATVRRRGKSGKNDPPPPPPPGQYYKKKNPKQNSKTNNPPTPLPETSPTPAPAAHTVTSKTTPPTPMPETSPIPATVPLLLGSNPVASKYDPKQHYCYNDKDNNEKYCWYYIDRLPYGNWEGFSDAAYGQCGHVCTAFIDEYVGRRRGKSGKNDPPPPPSGQYYKKKNPKKNSKLNNPLTPMPETSPIPATVPLLLGSNPVACDPPAASKYDPNHHFCYNDKDNNEKYCWYYHNDSLPFGNWKVFTGAAAGDCSTLCTKFASLVYDPNKHYCYGDKDNVGKYCWYKDVMKPYGNWAGPLRSAPCDCGSVCASTTCDGQC